MTPEDLFDSAENQLRQDLDPEQIINIDVDAIDEGSREESLKLFNDLSVFYYDEEFMKNHPSFRKKVDAEIESLRINIKMRKADEQTHDILLKAIGQNSNNASLYKSLSDIQRTIISITTKIEETTTRLENMMKGYQTEINFNRNNQQDEPDAVSNQTFRGSKAFIESQLKDE